MKRILLPLVMLFLASSCSNMPDGLTEEKVQTLIQDLIKREPKRVLSKGLGFPLGNLGKVAIMSVEVSNVSIAGKGNDRGLEVWTVNFRAGGTVAVSGGEGGKGAGIYEFRFDDRMQLRSDNGKWGTRFLD